MNTDEAFSFLGLHTSASGDEVEASFRQLVMVYHPDKNPDNSEWSHGRMILLNEAHDIAQRHISGRTQARSEARQRGGQNSQELAARIHRSFQAARSAILEGVHLYYTFNLENVHLRFEGIRRSHYNSSRRDIKKGVAQLGKIFQEIPEGKLKDRIRLYGEFGKSFYSSMSITKICPADTSLNYKAYKHYKNAGMIIDAFIKLCFFPGEFPRQDISPKSIILCEQSLLLILSNYRETIWVPEATIKLSLLDNLRNLVDFESSEAW
jgi:hypothetical protein